MTAKNLLHRIGANRRLLALLALAFAVIAFDLSLRAWDRHRQVATELREVRGSIAALAASSDQVDWVRRTLAVETARDSLAAQLWHSPTEAQAQARLRDWLASALRSAGVQRPTLTLLPPLTVAPASGSASGVGSKQRVLRVRASVIFELAPNALERALQQVENGGQLARVDNLTTSIRSRRVEMLVSVPVLLQPKGS